MSFSQEIKDFIGGYQSGYKLAKPTDEEIRERRRKEESDAIDADAKRQNANGKSTDLFQEGSESGVPGRYNPSGNMPSFAGSDDPSMASYLKTTFGTESGGNPNAKNPSSSATGLGQFTTGTWQSMIRQHPELGLTANGRTDPAQSRRATIAFTGDNIEHLKKNNIEPNHGNAYVAHFLGAPGAVRFIRGAQASPGAPATDFVDPSAASANRTIFFNKDGSPKTAGEVYRERTSRYRQKAETGIDMGDTQGVPTQYAADGGSIMPVMQMPPGTETADAPIQGIPTRQPAPEQIEGVPAHQQGIVRQNNSPGLDRVEGVHDAINAGLRGLSRAFGFDGEDAGIPRARPDYAANVDRYHRNEGAATEQEVQAVNRTIDPTDKMSEAGRAIARMKAGYEYYSGRGEHQKAENYAKSMLSYSRMKVQEFGAEAAARLRAGDVGGAAQAIQSGYNHIPDGATLHVDKVGPDGTVDYRTHDEDGDLTTRGRATANQLMHLATGMRNGSAWLEQLQASHGASTSAAEKRRRADDKALSGFYEAGGGNEDFLASLSPEAKSSFNAASAGAKRQIMADWYAKQKSDRGERSQDRKDRIIEEQSARREQQGTDQMDFTGHATAIENARDALAEQQQADPDDTEKMAAARQGMKDAMTAARKWATESKGRDRYVPQFERGAKGLSGGMGGAGGGSRGGGTAEERRNASLDQQFARADRAHQKALQAETDPAKRAAMGQQHELRRGQYAFERRATDYDKELGADVEAALPGVFGLKAGEAIPDAKAADADDYRRAVVGIMRGANDLTATQAATQARLAVNSGKLKPTGDGRFSANGGPGFYLSPDGLSALGRLAARAKAAEPKTTTVRNPFGADRPMTPDEEDAAAERLSARQQRTATRRRDKGAEWNRLREQIDDAAWARMEARGNVTLAQMRRQTQGRAMQGADIRYPNIP